DFLTKQAQLNHQCPLCRVPFGQALRDFEYNPGTKDASTQTDPNLPIDL
ncbi:MAG: hypothetical protein ACJAZS_000670, partial [Alteromonas naphthalenivorans]